jgi:hypothetical protein
MFPFQQGLFVNRFKRFFSLAIMGCAMVVSFGSAMAAEASNPYVTVVCANLTVMPPGWGVDKIIPIGNDFHITTTHLPTNFMARITVKAKPGYMLMTGSQYDMAPGDTLGWAVVQNNNNEFVANGFIILFRVDVEIDGVGADAEETVGAFLAYSSCTGCVEQAGVPAGTHAAECVRRFKPVKITCVPANRPDGERIIVTPPGDCFLLEVKNGQYFAAQPDYLVSEIAQKKFWLHGHEASGTTPDKEIKAEHNVNGCDDTAKFTVTHCKFTIYAKSPAGDAPINFSDMSVGHTSWSLEVYPPSAKDYVKARCQNPKAAKYLDGCAGYYPDGNIKVTDVTPPGKLVTPDESSGVQKSYDITIGQLVTGLEATYAIEQSPEIYILGTRLYYFKMLWEGVISIQVDETYPSDWNCTSVCLSVGKAMGLTMPSAETDWSYKHIRLNGTIAREIKFQGNSPFELAKSIKAEN